MIKISYPKNDDFPDAYLSKLGSPINSISSELDKYFKKLRMLTHYKSFIKSLGSEYYNKNTPELLIGKIAVAKFDELIKISVAFEKKFHNKKSFINFYKKEKGKTIKYKKEYTEICSDILGIFNYTGRQANIASFFMDNSKQLKISTCYFCNIDIVNVFNSFSEYRDEHDFLKNISPYELELLGVEKTDIDTVVGTIRLANKLDDVQDSTLSKKLEKAFKAVCVDSVNDINFKKKRNNFTLDHVLDKASHPLVSLSLYNLVPSCYACNSKLKGEESIVGNDYKSDLSPTSDQFSFHDDVKFSLLYKNGYSISNNVGSDNFVLAFDYLKRKEDYKNYVDVFKLRQRYDQHKSLVFELTDKSVRYSKTYINQISKDLKIPFDIVQKDIFGKELFEGDIQERSFTKLKRDIARQIGIEGVKED